MDLAIFSLMLITIYHTNIFIIFSDGKVVGGYSFPNEKLYGSVYSLNGEMVEEVAELSFQQWEENWDRKYNN